MILASALGLCKLSQRCLVPDTLSILASALWHTHGQQRMEFRIHGHWRARESVLQVYQLVDLAQATNVYVPQSLVVSRLQIVDCGR